MLGKLSFFGQGAKTRLNPLSSQLPNVNPETGESDKAVPYKVLMKFRIGLDPTHKMKPCVGCNAVPHGNGTVTVGDWVYIKKMVMV